MQVKNPDYKATILAEFRAQKFMDLIGARITKIEPGFCELELPYREELSQHHGFFHACMLGTLADNASGFAAYTVIAAGLSILTTEYKINFVAPGVGEKLVGRGRVVKAGRKLIVCTAEVFAVQDGAEKLCALSLSTMIPVSPA